MEPHGSSRVRQWMASSIISLSMKQDRSRSQTLSRLDLQRRTSFSWATRCSCRTRERASIRVAVVFPVSTISMGNLPTVPEDRGVFLEHTWRMHPQLCRFISDAFYESRLESHKSTEQQQLDLNDDCNGILAATGLRYVAVSN